MVMDAHERGDIEAVIGRASDFYGPGSFALSGDLMIKPALDGKPAKALGDIDQPHTWTYTEDYARGLIILGESDSAAGDVWHVPNPPTITTRELIEMFYAAADQGRPKIRAIGRMTVSFLGFFMPLMRELKEMMYEWEKPYVVDHSKFESAFGNPSTSHEEAVAQTIKWFKDYLRK
jgi:nucleoside-diphosphate-sugar epimerase